MPAAPAAALVVPHDDQARAWRTALVMAQCGVACAVFTDRAQALQWQAHQQALWQAEAQWRAQWCR